MAIISEKQAYEMGLIPKPKMNKFRNRHTLCSSGHSHRSLKEANCCEELKVMLRCQKIASFDPEVKYELLEAFVMKSGEKVRAINYYADFVVYHWDGVVEIIDSKGFQTAVFKLKWKLLKNEFKNKKNYVFTII